MLDIDFGTYPYVTSSNCLSASASIGSGVSPNKLHSIIGIMKAYTTRVGEGPFPTEEKGEVGIYLSKEGFEVGATTGRPRRCGWLDLYALKKAIRINGFTNLCLTKLDVLDRLPKIKVCTDYKNNNADKLKNIPIYKEFDGWMCSTKGLNSFSKLPHLARKYIEFVEDYLDVKINIVSTGPDRKDTIFTN